MSSKNYSLEWINFLILYVMDENKKNATLSWIYFMFYHSFISALVYSDLK